MVKRVCLLLLSCILTVLMSPVVLTATDDVLLSSISDARAVETVVLPEPEPEPELVVESKPVVTTRAPHAGTPVVPVTPNYAVTTYINSYSEYAASYANLSYSAIYKYHKMIYGHNTANLLGSLTNRYVGERITITDGGIVQNYVVSAKVFYNKTDDGYLNNDPYLMNNIAYTALGHDLALLTCAGRALGGGDATQRLVVYVDAV